MTGPAITPAFSRRAIPPGATVSGWTAPDGWRLRRLDWPGGGRGRLLFLSGRADFIEKYLESYAHLHDRGWTVTAIDWRGQGGSGRLCADPHVGHANGFAPWVADLVALWRDWSQGGGGRRVILGHSMGGYLALRAMLDGGVDPDAAVLVAPMLGLRSPVGAGLGLALARGMARLGGASRAAWREGARPGAVLRRQRLLTHDEQRHADEGWWNRERPETRLGPPSWRWLAEAFVATRALRADRRLATLAVPTLLLVADADALVDARVARRLVGRLPQGEIVGFGRESAHEILREVDAVRQRALGAIDEFLDRRAPR